MAPPQETGTIELATELPVSVGDTVTFNTAADVRGNPNLRVEVLAYQDGVLVYGEGGDTEHQFLLGGNPDGGSLWVQQGGGPAHCHANLYYFTKGGKPPGFVYLAATDFEAS